MGIYRAATEVLSGLPNIFFSSSKDSEGKFKKCLKFKIAISKDQINKEAHSLVKIFGIKDAIQEAQGYSDGHLDRLNGLKEIKPLNKEKVEEYCTQALYWAEVKTAIQKLYCN